MSDILRIFRTACTVSRADAAALFGWPVDHLTLLSCSLLLRDETFPHVLRC